MKNKTVLPAVAIVVVLVAAASLYFVSPFGAGYQQDSQAQPSQAATESSESLLPESSGSGSMEKDAAMEKGGGDAMDKGDAMMADGGYSGEKIAGSTTPYVRYNKADFDKARSEGRGIYLYFYATWCPLCQAERPSIISTFDSIDVANAVGFEVHWGDGQNTKDDDNIAREYGVASQHTHVFVGPDGKAIDRKIGRLSEGELESKLSQAAQA